MASQALRAESLRLGACLVDVKFLGILCCTMLHIIFCSKVVHEGMATSNSTESDLAVRGTSNISGMPRRAVCIQRRPEVVMLNVLSAFLYLNSLPPDILVCAIRGCIKLMKTDLLQHTLLGFVGSSTAASIIRPLPVLV